MRMIEDILTKECTYEVGDFKDYFIMNDITKFLQNQYIIFEECKKYLV